MSTSVFNSVVMYTPRGVTGSGEDLQTHYPMERQRYPGLAQSARDAIEANRKADEEARHRRAEWLAGRADSEHANETVPD